MSAVIHDAALKPKAGKKRNKAGKALRAIRRALARRKLEQMRDEKLLEEQIYDVFEDARDSE